MNIFGWGKGKVPINPKFQEMSHDELLLTAKTIKEANNNLKETLNSVTEENTALKNSIVKKKNSSDLKDIYKTLFLTNETNENEKNKEFNDFLYDQYLLYDGLEEEDINDLNQLKIKEENWSDNKDLFIFKQKIIERNYQKLFRNIAASRELQNLYGIKDDNQMNNSTEDNNNQNNIIQKENETKKEQKEKTDELVTLSDKIEGSKKKKKNKKKQDKEKEKEKPEKKESNKFNQGNLNPINNLKKDNINLDNLLEEEINDNEGLSFKDLSNKNNGWEEE